MNTESNLVPKKNNPKDMYFRYVAKFAHTSSMGISFHELYLRDNKSEPDKLTILLSSEIHGISMFHEGKYHQVIEKPIFDHVNCFILNQITTLLPKPIILIVVQYLQFVNIELVNGDSLRWFGKGAPVDKYPNMKDLIPISMVISLKSKSALIKIRHHIAAFKCLKDCLFNDTLYKQDSTILIILRRDKWSNYVYDYEIHKIISDSRGVKWDFFDLDWSVRMDGWIIFGSIKMDENLISTILITEPKIVFNIFSGRGNYFC